MKAVLLIDFGSTYTKLSAVDLDNAWLIGRSQAFTTASTDISLGLQEALGKLQIKTGSIDFAARLACSSAAGGLSMIASGLVPGLTSKAAKMAAFGAGAKVIKTYAYQLTREDVEEIGFISPDILLLSGGIDGGNSEVIIHNAGMLAGAGGDFPVVIAGNRSAQSECEAILRQSSHPVYTAPNVMPEMNVLNLEPVTKVIREIFLKRIVLAKGLNKASALLDNILMPTPSAVLSALSLLSKGTAKQTGLGDLLAVDLGGATTDVYSIAKGEPVNPGTVLRGLPEPLIKRTVEGDLGMRYNAQGILEAIGLDVLSDLSGLPNEAVTGVLSKYRDEPSALPASPEEKKMDRALASAAISLAISRHAGKLERVFTPVGPVYEQTGKDLTQTKRLIVTGGALIYADDLDRIVDDALKLPDAMSLVPRSVKTLRDQDYLLSAMGLLSSFAPEVSFTLMKAYFGKDESYATD